MKIEIQPVGFVEAERLHAEDDVWGGQISCISLVEPCSADSLLGLADFSHVEVLFFFHEADPSSIANGARHPRNNPIWPRVGIFAQRGRNRPNLIGSTICRIIRVEGARLYVAELDAVAGTPVIDLKPVMAEFLPRQEVRQPAWSHDVMRRYWAAKA
jgi:tRNA (Thr-GGU) A37 N-methylase